MCNFLFLTLLYVLPQLINCGCPTIIKRSEWRAATPKKSPKSLSVNPAPYVVVHHSDTPKCLNSQSCKSRVKNIQSYHQNHNDWDDIGYNFLIGGDGNVYEGRGWGVWGAHVPKYNSNSIGICVIGHFMNEQPPDIQLQTLKDLIACGKDNNYLSSTYQLIGHRQGKPTTCPGDMLFNQISTWPHFDASVRA